MLQLSGISASNAVGMHFLNGLEATQAVVDGKADFVCNNAISIVSAIKSGALRGLMTTAQGRMAELPDLLNASEIGLRDMMQLQGWSALFAPKDLSPDALIYWKKVLQQIARDPQWQESNRRIGGISTINAIDNPASFVRQQAALYTRLVTTMEIQP